MNILKEIFLMKSGKPSLAPLFSIATLVFSIIMAVSVIKNETISWTHVVIIAIFIVATFAPHAIGKVAKTATLANK